MQPLASKSAVAAIRVSTTKQGTDGDSPDAQKEQIERFAADRGIIIKKFFVFLESASKEQQPMQEAVDYCTQAKNGIDLFIIKSIDRFTRGGSLSYDILKNQLEASKVQLVEKYKRPLIISVSGDGGYNEVINGIMDAKDKSAREPVVAIVAAGNANDHKRLTRGDTPLLTLIKKNQPKPLDLIRVKSKGIDRYAHSYAGLGITPEVGIELNKHSLSFVKEVGIVLKTFRNFTPFEIIVEGKRRKMGSLVFANVQGMAKVIKLTSKSTLQDGKFDIIRLSYPNKFRFLLSLLLMTLRPHPSRSMSSFTFTTTSKLPIQLDGEIEKLAARSEVEVTSVKSAVMSLY